LFAAIFLSVPVWLSSDHPTNISTLSAISNWPTTLWLALIWLAVVPSVLGFYCTTKAVDLLPPAKVQILELTEPVFTAVFAGLLLGEHLSFSVILGGIITLLGVYWAHRS
jgi:drug/metabolite transporter (DMT)-like permease